MSVIDLYERAYIPFIDDFVSRRIFVEKSGSVLPSRDIKTLQDCGEAVIDLINLKQDFQTALEVSSSHDNIQKETILT